MQKVDLSLGFRWHSWNTCLRLPKHCQWIIWFSQVTDIAAVAKAHMTLSPACGIHSVCSIEGHLPCPTYLCGHSDKLSATKCTHVASSPSSNPISLGPLCTMQRCWKEITAQGSSHCSGTIAHMTSRDQESLKIKAHACQISNNVRL